jgi:carbon storage regulator
MLVLSRRQRESIVINDDIVVTVIKIRRNQVHLAFEAPKETPIHRREIYDALSGFESTPARELASAGRE